MDYVGLRWYKCDFHLHTMSSKCYEDEDTIEAWVDEVERKELNCIAVTDHNDYRYIDKIKEEAEKRNITVFPGVELTCDTAKIHVLILFNTDCNADDVRDYLTGVGIDKRAVENGEVTSESIFNVCDKAKKLGCIVIPAHIDELNGINSMSDANISKLLTGKYIDAVQVVNEDVWENKDVDFKQAIRDKYNDQSISDEKIDAWYKSYKKAKTSEIPFIMSSDNPRAEHDAKHGLWGIGRDYCWIKMGDTPNIEGLRQAFLSYKERIRTSYQSKNLPERLPEVWIKSITVNGVSISPYCGINLEFNTQLNTIIGGRGSGKSSIIRLIAGALKSAKFDDLEVIKAEQENFYQLTDKNGKGVLAEKSSIEVQIYRNGILYKIIETDFKKKSSSFSIMKYNQELDTWDAVKEEQFIDFLLVDTYTQKQIYELAQAPDALGRLIDKDNEELPVLLEKADEAYSELIDKIKELRLAKDKIKEEAKLSLELKDLNNQIDVYKKSGFTSAIEEKTKYENEKNAIDSYLNSVKSIGNELVEYSSKEHISRPIDTFLSDDIKTILKKGKNSIDVVFAEIKKNGESIVSQYELLKGEVEKSEWNIRYQESIAAYDNAKTKLDEQHLEADKLDELLEKQKQKEQDIKALSDLKNSILDIEKEIGKLETKYNTQLNNIRNCRKAFIDSILSDDQDVKIEYIEKANKKSVEDLLLKYTQSTSTNVVDDIYKVAEQAVSRGGLKRFRSLIEKIVNEEEVSGVSMYFQRAIKNLDSSLIDQILSFVPTDDLQVSYKNAAGKLVPLHTASPGQKTTAILTFILAYGDRPLLLDQPEDDLDNRLVYDLVVKQLKKSKKHRQIIVVTHNANIPVNGDAEYIISMDSSSRYVAVKNAGTIDNDIIREEICDVMEGTEFAFKMRAKKYHVH
ncbi:PHP domain-containing protein [Butyrivibrio hungatei]|uniref:PHP domain-containing protein n=1 Tax=Butyrivibrio hungatei TaxID=185008 RepID=A0A1G5BD36_9FIRM|nr:PHP domain-containing protein [Butyrivibrio hungatei]SCX88039.1 PHP domain-containing protein [Butyrivibrio hungatei]